MLLPHQMATFHNIAWMLHKCVIFNVHTTLLLWHQHWYFIIKASPKLPCWWQCHDFIKADRETSPGEMIFNFQISKSILTFWKYSQTCFKQALLGDAPTVYLNSCLLRGGQLLWQNVWHNSRCPAWVSFQFSLSSIDWKFKIVIQIWLGDSGHNNVSIRNHVRSRTYGKTDCKDPQVGQAKSLGLGSWSSS